MNCDFQTTASQSASARDEMIFRIKQMVDLVKQDLEKMKSNDIEDYNKQQQGDNTLLSSVSSSSRTPTIVVDDGTSFLRNLFREERETLKDTCRCSCTNDDWSKIYLMLPTNSTSSTMAATTKDQNNNDLSLDLKSLVSNTHFDGFVILDMNTNEENNTMDSSNKAKVVNDWSKIPPGMHSNICVSDSIIHVKSCRVYRNSFVSRTFIGANVVLMNCGHISSSSSDDEIGTNGDFFGTLNISVGAESGGGRSLLLTAESTIIDVCRQLQQPCDKIDDDLLPSSSIKPSFIFNILLRGSIICDTSRVQNVFLSPFSSIEAACSVKNSTLFDNAQISSGSIVSNVLMQWNASISGNSKINSVFMMEHSHLGPSSIVESTVIGPDSHASAGEIHASIIGPNTNAHHQSLLIGVLWPLGRGNVAYGANVGSNHTGRLPDQECTAGEGIFWGLSCIVKFPIDLSMAPYSMVAAGTRLAPQRITMPFSLIVESSGDDRSLNDIVPGWVLQHSPYTLARNDKKFATRRKAKRHTFYTGWKILRPSTIERCRIARSVLRKSLSAGGNPALSSQNISGVGECRLTERARNGGIKAYDNCIQLYALRGLLSWLNVTFDTHKDVAGDDPIVVSIGSILREEFVASGAPDSLGDSPSKVEWSSFPWESDEKEEWEYQRKLLLEEFPTKNDKEFYEVPWIRTLLNNLLRLEKDLAERIAKCKQRDDTRGVAIIPGYNKSHVMVETDPVVMDALENQKITEKIVENTLHTMNVNPYWEIDLK
jgi:hypothetical protein